MMRHDPAPGSAGTRRIVATGRTPPAPVPEARLTQTAVALANRLLSGLTPGDALLVCGLTSHRGVADLARMAARGVAGLSGLRVLLVEAQSAHPPSSGPLPAGQGPGFTDLLAGAPLTAEMLHSLPDSPLRMVGLGTRPELVGAGILMPVSVGAALSGLRAEADLLCLLAAPLSQSVGTASLAKHVEASLLCVHRAVDRRDVLAQGASDLAASGSRFLGTVLLH